MSKAISKSIVEERDATESQRWITEVNMSCYVFDGRQLFPALDRIDRHNAQGEYYLTDCPGVMLAAGQRVLAINVLQPCEALEHQHGRRTRRRRTRIAPAAKRS